MTTIACADGLIAADTKYVGDYVSYGSKIIETPTRIYALIGTVAYARVLVDLLESGLTLAECRRALREDLVETADKSFALVVIDREEFGATVVFEDLVSETIQEPWAFGSGGNFAMGALFAGCTAEEAVNIAAQLDAATGGEIEVIEILKDADSDL